ncbi:hypothetical protein ACJIZ3_024910 [Penstemon smallii]|uniref:EXS domain-containing protein n=1 Tax=Penstemon smallii TaxID=265156 RepID=A0ABD3TT90_9LAMI
MFGGPVSIPNNSPNLRKSGSRPVMFDISTSELASSSEEDLLHTLQSNEMKGVNISSSSAAIMPSPVLLCRLKNNLGGLRKGLGEGRAWRWGWSSFPCLVESKRKGRKRGGLVLLFFVWGFICCKIGWDSVMRMSTDLRDLFLYEAFLYYNPLLLVTMMVWLWGINLWVFAQANIGYSKIFDLDQSHLTHREIWKCATWMTMIVPTSMTAYLYLYSHGEVSLAASQPVAEKSLNYVILYAAVAMTLIFPFDIFYLSSRYYLLRTSWRIFYGASLIVLGQWRGNLNPRQRTVCLLFPSSENLAHSSFAPTYFLVTSYLTTNRFNCTGICNSYATLANLYVLLSLAITFADFFLADIFTSMSKVFSDLERSVCRMVHQQVATIAWFEADSVCGSHSVAIPIVLVLPYIFRLFQCLRQYKDTREKTSLLNALKYSTAVPVIFFSALKYHVFPEKWTNIYRPLWVLSGVLNALYSFYWDITRDWDLRLGPVLIVGVEMSGSVWVYFWVIGSNLILRCTWTYKLSAHLRHNYITVFAITALEIFRRFQWVFFRVENEWNKRKSNIQMTDIPNEEDKLLGSNVHEFVKRENALLGYDPQSVTSNRSSDDMDFNDVFGGPPRRFSMQEVRVRYSFSETQESEEERSSSPWVVLKEKPVFGEETVARKRHQGDEFYDDIFRADESYNSPRKSDRDRDTPFGSNPGSRIMSPARPVVSKPEPFGTSLPAQFSLPAKLTKVVEYPTFPSRNQKTDEGASGLSSPQSPSAFRSRFSNQPIWSQDELRNEVQPVYRQSLLSHEASLSSVDSPSNVAISDQKENVEKSKKETQNVDSDGNQFHFSIYKWPGRGVPMLMALVDRNNLKSKGINRKNRRSVSDGRMENDHIESEPELSKIEHEKKEVQNSSDGVFHEIQESKFRRKAKDNVDSGGMGEKTKKEVPMTIKESRHAFLADEVKQRGNIAEIKENKTRTTKGVRLNENPSKNVKKNEETIADYNRANVDKFSLQSETKISGVTHGKSGVENKVKEFVQIFNEEVDVQTRSQSSRWKAVGIEQKENEASLNAATLKEKVNLKIVDKKPDISVKVDENIIKDEIPDDPFEVNFMIEELPEDHEKITGEDSEDMKALDAKIQQWSVGKKGNIRSLLSTLQYVLWDGSGWTSVPLVDLIEANSVKRAYQKALLRLHPDKLQQKGAASSHKYIAEKVFDILQEAWDHFNTVAPL